MSSVRPGGARQPTVRVHRSPCRPAPRCGCGAWRPGATYREDLGQLLVPVGGDASAPDAVRSVIEELIPPADAGPGGDSL